MPAGHKREGAGGVGYIIGIPHIQSIAHIFGIHHDDLQHESHHFFGSVTTAASAVRNIQARDTDSSRATLSTFLGSIIHFSTISTNVLLAAS